MAGRKPRPSLAQAQKNTGSGLWTPPSSRNLAGADCLVSNIVKAQSLSFDCSKTT